VDIPELLDVASHRGLSFPLPNRCQFGELQLIDPSVEVPVEYLFKIGPPVDRIQL
jgi:hypothetical protein